MWSIQYRTLVTTGDRKIHSMADIISTWVKSITVSLQLDSVAIYPEYDKSSTACVLDL